MIYYYIFHQFQEIARAGVKKKTMSQSHTHLEIMICMNLGSLTEENILNNRKCAPTIRVMK